MHETSVAQHMISAILDESRQRHARPVRVKVSCGQLNALNDAVFGFAFEAMARGTACEGVEIAIEHKPFRGRCRHCETVFTVDFDEPVCPSCGGTVYDLLPDAPLLLEEIEFREE